MKVKVFKIRLSPEFLESDENAINDFLESNKISKTATSFVENGDKFWTILVYYNESIQNEEKPKRLLKDNNNQNINTEKFECTREDLDQNPLNELEIKILTNLKSWRVDKSNELNLPPYIIFTNNDLISVTRYNPNDISQLYNIKGFGDTKIEKYGDDILAIINATTL